MKKSLQMSRPPLERMLRLHEELREGRLPNCRKMAEEFEVSTKTIQRDLEFMRDRLDLPIAYDPEHFGYRYTEPVGQFPTVQVTEGEMVALFVAQKALVQYRGTPFERPLQAAFEKLTDGLRDEVSFRPGSLDAYFSFRALGASEADLGLFEVLSRAVRQSREIAFGYRKLNGSSHEQRTVDPYHLTCVDNQWYLFARDLARDAIRTFALPRMRGVMETGKMFVRPPDFSPGQMLKDSFGIFSGGKPVRVKIRFDAFASQLVRERFWHQSQKVRELAEGRLELEMTLGSLPEVERWVLGWGEHAEVLAPPELRQSVAAIVRKLDGRYRMG